MDYFVPNRGGVLDGSEVLKKRHVVVLVRPGWLANCCCTGPAWATTIRDQSWSATRPADNFTERRTLVHLSFLFYHIFCVK